MKRGDEKEDGSLGWGVVCVTCHIVVFFLKDIPEKREFDMVNFQPFPECMFDSPNSCDGIFWRYPQQSFLAFLCYFISISAIQEKSSSQLSARWPATALNEAAVFASRYVYFIKILFYPFHVMAA